MQIEIAEPGRMTQTGSSLIRLIQNNNMPVLDLLVRESIQNSLDARKKDSKYVEVEYLTGDFCSEDLGGELDQLGEPLSKRFGKERYEYIAVRDTQTVGLTGEMDYKKVKDNAYGNLLKLVYEICKPQEAEGAGGSWGIGKTVYFRIGIGLVIYYSRIKNEDGLFESRLAASLVENETSNDAMIPEYKGLSRRGIAWWGKEVDENITQPVTDEEYISSFLNIFAISKYEGEETGTTIIIPYIDKEKLLANNRIEYLNDQEQQIIPFWGNNLEKYLSISAQRWYAPRLNNAHYQQGAYLRMKINNQGIGSEKMEPIFKVIQALYNRANHVVEDDILSEIEEVKTEQINVRKYLDDSTIGVLSYAKVNRSLLKMNAPDNKPEPYMYFNNEIRDSDVNKPTVCFTRKPAMVVSYENVGAWVPNISSSKDEYIFAIFVLNSFNKLKNCPSIINIEEYIRKSEMADHTSWSDWSEGNYNPRFVNKIQTNINKIISREFTIAQESITPKENSGLGKLFGDLLLPKEGFGKGPSPTPKPPVNPPSPRGGLRFMADSHNVRYQTDHMIIPLVLETSSKKKAFRLKYGLLIDSESKKIEIDEWERQMGLDSPFVIKEYRLIFDIVDGKKSEEVIVLKANDIKEINDMVFSGMATKKGTCYGLRIISDIPKYIKMRIEVIIEINRRDVKPAFSFEKEA